jgi:hypothetical protein
VEGDPTVVHGANELGHVIDGEAVVQRRAGHVATGREGHLPVLDVEARRREVTDAPGVVVVQVGDDHVGDGGGVDPDRRQRLGRRSEQAPAPARRVGFAEPGVHHPRGVVADRHPHEVVHRHGRVVGVAADEVLGAPRVALGVLQRVDAVGARPGHAPVW